MKNKYLIGGIVTLILVVFLAWLFIISTKPLPGEKILQDGRDHLSEGIKIDYKSSPPTSGDHYASWISKGFYDEPRPDGNLVHSLEHGYVILWYDCSAGNQSSDIGSRIAGSLVKTAYAQGLNMTQGSEGSPSAKLEDMPQAFRDGSCDPLKNEVRDMVNRYGPHKLIGMPRPGMGSRLILTAWGRKLTIDPSEGAKIKEFIGAFRDNGPEHTVEP